MEIGPEQAPRLGHWLAAAARGIAILPIQGGLFHVYVHNGEFGTGTEEGRIVATCTSDLEAELVATALWSLVTDVRSGEKADAPVALPGDRAIERLLETVAEVEDAHADEPKPKWRHR